MTKKILKSSTIVPSHLYVEREADRQVREIIDGMGRPGYVLVARQMGKTNLLLNAKRCTPKNGDIFLYLDISNLFPDLRSFFRNIIDTAIDIGGDYFINISKKIHLERTSSSKLPHKEHEWELRELLKTIPGRLIVCLDEIDAIAGAEFSDQVFSFIRSTYFSCRSNFCEFERLTYLLSGVAEPSEIIKNKNVSPFNIGEKIFLNDFSRIEFDEFLSQSNIGLNSEVADRVFYWTNGHPRMTWDVCSALEGKGILESEKVDSIISDLYFNEVGIPPLDHIKKLVEDSQEIRDAIMSIHYKKTGGMLDTTKTKLYLAGISGYSPDGTDIVFKNKIFEDALSETWIFNLEQSVGSVLFDSCLSIVSDKNYAAALPKLLILINNCADQVIRQQAKFLAGLCCFHLSKFDQALEHLGDDVGPALDAVKDARRNLLCGISNYRLDRYQPAMTYLRYASNMKHNHKSDLLAAEAKVYLASAMINDNSNDFDQIKDLCNNGLLEIKNLNEFEQCDSLKVSQLRGFIALVIASACSSSGQLDRARETLQLAISESDGYIRSTLRLALFEQTYETTAVEILLNELLSFKNFGLDNFIGLDHVPISKIYPLLNHLAKRGKVIELEKLLKHIFISMYSAEELTETITHLAGSAINRGNQPLGLFIIGVAVDFSGNSLDLATKRELWYVLISLDTPKAVYRYARPYIDSFLLHPKDKISVADLRTLFLILVESEINFYNEIANDAMSVVFRDVIDNDLSNLEKSSILIVREFLRVKKLAVDKNPEKPYIQDLLNFHKSIDNINKFNLSPFPDNFLSTLRIRVLNLVKSEGLLTIRRNAKKIGRNDIIKVTYGGVIQSGKFKKFENDLLAGHCQLVD